MDINTYYLKARLFPTVLTSVPIVWGYNHFVAPIYEAKLTEVYSALPEITNVVLSGAIVFLLTQVNRFISKEIFQRLFFKEDLNMPSTDYLLKKNDKLDKTTKKKIEDKIKEDFEIKLLSEAEEIRDESRARKVIVSAVAQIKNVLRENQMLFQHNIEYGFVRNLLGGAFLAFIVGAGILVAAYVKGDRAALITGYISMGIYIIPLFLSKPIIVQYGNYYAKVLYEQFLSKSPVSKK